MLTQELTNCYSTDWWIMLRNNRVIKSKRNFHLSENLVIIYLRSEYRKEHENWDNVTKKNGYHRKLYRLMRNGNESINSIVWSSCAKILFCGMHRFTISSCETLLQFNNNLRVQFNEGKGYQGEKRKIICQTNHIYQPGAFTYKSNPWY